MLSIINISFCSSFYKKKGKADNYNISDFYPDLVCASKFSYDKQWYRAVIQSVDVNAAEAKVFYVDWGNTDTCEFSNLRLLDSQFFEDPIYSTPFSLAFVS